MAPSKWEEEEEDSSSGSEDSSPPVVAPVRRKFDDEEDSDEVLDSWDAAEDSEVEREKQKKVVAAKAKADAEATANKKSKAQRIEEHREAARRRMVTGEEESSDEDEDEADRRARLRQTEQDADLKHAQALFDNVGLGAKTRGNKATVIEDPGNSGQTIDLSTLSLFKPANKTQFEALSTTLVPLLTALSSKAHYSLWIQDFVKKITADLPSTEIKKAASALTALSNEKLKEEKAAEKGGKKTKGAKKTTLAAGRDIGRGAADTTAYDEGGLDDGDFM